MTPRVRTIPRTYSTDMLEDERPHIAITISYAEAARISKLLSFAADEPEAKHARDLVKPFDCFAPPPAAMILLGPPTAQLLIRLVDVAALAEPEEYPIPFRVLLLWIAVYLSIPRQKVKALEAVFACPPLALST